MLGDLAKLAQSHCGIWHELGNGNLEQFLPVQSNARVAIQTIAVNSFAIVVSYIDFDHSLIKPRPRNYAVAKKEDK